MDVAYASRKVRIKQEDTWLPEELYIEHLRRFPVVAVDIVVTDTQGRILLVKRNENNLTWAGNWATPGGRVYRNESLVDAARRILRREVGLNLETKEFAPSGVQEIITPKQHGVTIIFRARTDDTNVHVDQTSSEARWFTPRRARESLRSEYVTMLALCGVYSKGA